jgi:hypothetical protein
MTHKLLMLVFTVTVFGFAGCAAGNYSETQRDHTLKADTLRMMKIQDVINLSKAGVSDSLIIGMMDATDSWFPLKTQDVIDLRNAGVNEKVIVAMIQPPAQPSGKTSDANRVQYYTYPSFWWYDGFYPYWYYPSFSVRLGYHPLYMHHRRFR